MAHPRLAEAGYAITAFDLPGHGRSAPAAEPGAWALDTDLYAELILGFLDAWRNLP
jgi:pimeloyl-ACP methyl ester carboxylesterase